LVTEAGREKRQAAIVSAMDSLMPEYRPQTLSEGAEDTNFELLTILEGICPICLDPFVSPDSSALLRTTPTCNHTFHSDCIGQWVSMNMPEPHSVEAIMRARSIVASMGVRSDGGVLDLGPPCPVCRSPLELDVYE
jgi:hypothetical protein